MLKDNCDTHFNIVRPSIEKSDTEFREVILAKVQLAITLRFLATCGSY